MVWKILETESKSFIITHQVKSWTAVQDIKKMRCIGGHKAVIDRRIVKGLPE